MHVDTTATGYICHQANSKNSEINLCKNTLEVILREIHQAKEKTDIDFHGLWQPAIEKVIPELALFRNKERDKEYRSAISRYYFLRKAAYNVQATKSKDLVVLSGDAGSMCAKVFVNDAVSLVFSTTLPLYRGKVNTDQLNEEPKVLRARLSKKEINPRIYDEARKKAAAAMNKFR